MVTAAITTTVEHSFVAMHTQPGAISWSMCRSGHGASWRVILELAGDADDLPANGLLGGPEAIADFQTWAESTFDHLRGHHTLNDLVPSGTAVDLARWVWEHWHKRLPELRAVVVDESVDSVGATADWPEGASAAAATLRADHQYRRAMREVENDYWGTADWDPVLTGTPLITALTSWAWHYKTCGRWDRGMDLAAAGPSSEPHWHETLAEAVPHLPSRAAIAEGVQKWLQACYVLGALLRDVGTVNQPVVREQVWEAKQQILVLSESWMGPLCAHMVDVDASVMEHMLAVWRRLRFRWSVRIL